MDPKNKDLNPDLKQIYERVMNTPVRTQTPLPEQNEQKPQEQMPNAAPTTQTSSPPPPSGGTFVFKSGSHASEQKQAPAATVAKPGKNSMISGKIIAVLVVILLVVWGIFWAKFFSLF